ncbi:MAG: Rrf2 family transcriptional regulator [Caldisericota bacterium]|nr:Rrf2 family transcriptional regulator [Caldisericota bacterium]
MLVTTLEGYALKALIYLAEKKNKRATIREISKENNISFSYILRICSMLRSNGLLDSVRGRSGGYILTRDPADISLYEIIQAVGRETVEIKCNYGKRKDIPCITTDCLALLPWEKTKSKVDKLFKSITLKILMEGKR